MKRFAALLLAAACCLPFAACGRTAYQKTDANTLPVIPLPNGKTTVYGERIALPAPLGVDPGEFSLDYFAVFAQRAGVGLSGEAPGFLRASREEGMPPESYRLRVTDGEGILIEAADEQGLCWALATLAALTLDGSAPRCDIEDAPYYAYRGFMMDSVRHFFPVETIKALIELTSMTKINVFHWHLTDDQGWRIESRRFPALHAQHEDTKEYYTREEIRDVIEFARVRGVEVIPEIDMPGHAMALIAAFPALSCSEKPVTINAQAGIRNIILCAGKDAVFELLFPLLEEMAALFPSRYVHLGGDEAPKEEWGKCPHCLRRVEEEGLENLEELQGWFTIKMAEHLRILGKQVICWNESLLSERLPSEVEDLTIQYWAEAHAVGPARRFWEQGGSMIFSEEFGTYSDLPHGAVTLKKVYNYRPAVLDSKGEGLPVWGIEGAQWTEFISTTQELARLTFPRAYANAEAAWTSPERKNYKDFLRRLDLWLERYPGMGFTLPKDADPGFFLGWKGKIAFLRKLATAFGKDDPDSAGVGGKLHWRYLLHWGRNYFI